jgi:sugar lactone lactonase YvrE
VTIEEQRLSEMLHRVTPDPPRHVTVEDIAIRLANKNAPARGAGRGVTSMSGSRMGGGRMDGGGMGGGGRPSRGRLTPLLAAASVVAIAGASAGIAVALSSHSSKLSASGGVVSPATAQTATSPPTSQAQSVTTTPASEPVVSGSPITNGAWGAATVVPTVFTPGSLIASGGQLYAFTTDNLLEVDPSTNTTVNETSYEGFPYQAPVVADGKIWTVTTYGGTVGLTAYNPRTLAQDGTLSLPASGGLAGEPDGVLTAGPNGDLYVAAGTLIDEVNPANGSVIQHYEARGGAANALAVSPDGSTLYAGSVGSTSFLLTEYNVASGTQEATATEQASVGGEMVATPGGVWFTTGYSMAERVWFAPAGNLSGARLIAGAGNGGQDSVPTYADGVVWVGGAQRLQCLDPDTGQVRASSYIPSDNGIQEDIGDIAVLNGRVYAVYVNNRTDSGGVALLNPPSACYSSSAGSGS